MSCFGNAFQSVGDCRPWGSWSPSGHERAREQLQTRPASIVACETASHAQVRARTARIPPGAGDVCHQDWSDCSDVPPGLDCELRCKAVATVAASPACRHGHRNACARGVGCAALLQGCSMGGRSTSSPMAGTGRRGSVESPNNAECMREVEALSRAAMATGGRLGSVGTFHARTSSDAVAPLEHWPRKGGLETARYSRLRRVQDCPQAQMPLEMRPARIVVG